jgi:hypothetical protein
MTCHRSFLVRLPALLAFIAGLLMSASPAVAAVTYDWSGFGTIGVGRIFKEDGYLLDYDEQWSSETDSVLGLQLDVVSSSGLSLTAQAVAAGYNAEDPEHHYQPEMELLFGAWQVSDYLRLRGGLLRTPFFLYSDSIDTGYAYPWARPPIDVYSTLSQVLSQMEGVDASYFQKTDAGTIEYRIAAGKHRTDYYLGETAFELDLDPLFGVAITADIDTTTLRYSFYRASSTLVNRSLSGVEDGLLQLGQAYPVFNEVAANLGNRDLMQTYHVLGGQWEIDRWSVAGEASYIPSPGKQLGIEISSFYVSLTRHIGPWSPYVLFSWFQNTPDPEIFDALDEARALDLSALGTINNQVREFLDVSRDALRELDYNNRRRAIGVRYDFPHKCDIKVEFEHYDINGYRSVTPFPTTQNMITVMFDWVF